MMTTFTKNSAKTKINSIVLILLLLVISFNSFSQVNCSCPGNLITNPSFESGTTGWATNGGGTLAAGTGGVACGTYSGDLNNTTADSWAQQTIGTDLAAGTTINVSVYAGTHDNSFHNYVQISFYNASNVWLASSVTVQVDKILASAPAGPQLYTINAVVPSGVKYTKVTFGGNGSYTKTDNWCVTTAAPSSCTCPGNLVLNPSFENGTTSWGFSGGNFNAGTGAIVCGTKSGDFEITNTSSNWVSQTIGTDLPIGTILNGSVYAGTHDNSVAHSVQVNFFNASWTFISAVSIPVNKILANAPVGPQLYTFTATVPANTKYTQAVFSGHGGWIKTDNWCITATPPSGTGSIGDRVWGDANGNGIQDAGETNGFTGVTVQLKNATGTVIATTSTNGTGNYLFAGLAAGNYTVVFPVSLSGATVTGQNVGGDDAIDSDASQTTGETGTIALAAGQNIINVDAGYCPTTLQLGNRVWDDVNNDGLNNGELGIAGVTVNLYKDNDNNNVADGAIIATTTTDADGFYLFSGLVPGNYIIGVVRPTGFVSSAVNGGDPDNDINLDDNGQITVGNETRGLAITLNGGTEPDGTNTNTDTNITYDFGFYAAPTGSIGDRVWFDANGNGIQDATETTPITGVTVQLKNAAGTVIATTTTNATGNYLFSGLVAGNYTVVFPISISGATVTTANVGADDNVDSDASQATGETGTITLAAGQNITNVDAGYCPTTLALGDRVYYDLNNNGVRDATEVGIEGLTVNLYKDNNNDNIPDGPSIATTLTNATGNYRFDNLVPGNYIVGVTPPAGYSSSTNAAIDPDNDVDLDDNGTNLVGTEWRGLAITLTGGAEPLETGNFNNTYDFGFYPTASIGDFVWNDLNGNGVQDAGEPGISGVTVNLLNSAGTVIATTTTNATGGYSFPNVAPGTYSVTFSTPAGYTPTGSNLGGNDATDSDPIGGTVTGIVITAGQTNTTIDAGFYQPAILGNFVWNDVNANGVQDATETGIAGVTVNLLNSTGTVIGTTTTSATGAYSFTNLAPGTYGVSFTTPAGYTASPSNVTIAGATDANDSDPVAGIVTGITLTSGQTNNTIDAGFYQPGSIGNFVWNDTNGNGIQDAGEAGITGVTVNLLNAAGTVIATTTTDANGNYNFPNVVPGTYSVTFTTPAGYSPTGSNLGGNDNTDSDPIGGTVTGVVVTAGVANNTVDAGYYQLVNLGNTVWYDQNNDGTKQPTESGISAATVNLYLDANNDNVADGAAIATTTTDANGLYNFANLAPGNYIVGVNIPTGYAVVTTNAGDPDNNTDNDNNGTNTSVAGEVRSSAVTLSAGTEPATAVDGDGTNGNLTVDFGFKGTGSIGDFVFNDVNGNGVQDAGELGIPGATVVLTYPNGTTVSTTTDANGNYNFPNLAPGSYSITFTTPSGLTASPSNVGANDGTDSDPVGGTVTGIALTAGQVNNTVDAGFFAANVMNLGNIVWYDQNNDGTKQATETGIAGATVRLYLDANNDNVADGAAIATTTTDANGVYNFAGLAAGNYIVGVNIPTGYAVVTTNGGDPDNNTDNDNNGTNTSVAGEVRSSAITLALTTEPTTDGDGNNGNLTVDFGFRGTASIGDFVFNDVNGNGVQDAGEFGIPGATVVLTYPNGTTVTTTTDANGNYNFPNLAPGSYNVTFTTPSGLTASPSNVGANDGVDSDPIGGTVTGIVLTAGQVNNTVDAGFFAANVMNLGNVVWYDQNNDGTKQATETGIAGATVRLYLDANNDNVADGAAIATTTTDANGLYNFGGLAAGNYIVGVNIPTGYAVVTTNGGDPDNNTDNDNNGTNTSVAGEVRSSAITLALTTEPTTDGDGNNGNLTVDFGFKGTASIGNFVFSDVNANGIQDVTETGIAGVTVTLTNPNGTTTTTTTDANGLYSFPNLAPGTYSVAFTTPAGYNVSPSNVTTPGATDANDSDPVGGVVTGIVLTAGQVNETIDAGFYNCLPLNSGINGQTQICANETAVFNATGAGSGSVYSWTFMNGNPATATGVNVSSTWSVPGEYDITLTVTKNGCTSTYVRSIVITQAIFANAGPDADICSGTSTTLNGSGPASALYSWIVISGDPTSIDNGTNQSSILVSPLITTTYQLTVSQNGCTKIDQVTVFINVSKNPVADAGLNKTILLGSSVVIGGSPTGTPPVATPGSSLSYIWSPAAGINVNGTTNPNPTVTPTAVGTTNYRVIVFASPFGCSDTAFVNVTAIQPVNVGNNVWYDKNNNGIKEAGEPGVSTTVKLYEDANNDNVPDGAAIATTTTVNGAYNFGNLFPGNYIVGATIPAGYAVVTTNGGDPDNNTDNDNNGTITTVPGEVRSATVTLTAGTEPLVGIDGDDNNGNLTVDIALIGTAKIGDFVWYDSDRDGIQDAGEAGIPNATVTLTYPDGSTLITTTNATGAYSFANLAPGSYNIGFTTPAGLTATVSNSTGAGATDNNDSDPVSGVVNGLNLTAGEINNSVDAGFHNSCTNRITGNVWNDLDADNGIDSIGINTRPAIPNGLVMSLVSLSTGKVINTSLVNGFGQYSFSNVPVGNYSMVLSTLENNIGDVPPAAVLPNRWFYVGESFGLDAGGVDILNNGSISFNKSSLECVTNINFGIKFSNQAGGID